MIPRIVAYRTKHFEFRVPIDEWNEKKIPLPEGAGAQFIAPSDLTAILLKPFYYDWSYETDGRIPLWLAYKYKLSAGNASCLGEPPFLVYGEEWVGKEIRHFPWCKELLEFLDCLKKQYGWTIAESWGPIVYSLTAELARERGVSLEDIRGSQKSLALRGRFDLAFSGYVWKGNLWHVDSCGCFWSATEFSADNAGFFYFDSDGVDPKDWKHRECAQSVRFVSESGSFPNS